MVHELEPKLIITIMHGQQHIKMCLSVCKMKDKDEIFADSADGGK